MQYALNICRPLDILNIIFRKFPLCKFCKRRNTMIKTILFASLKPLWSGTLMKRTHSVKGALRLFSIRCLSTGTQALRPTSVVFIRQWLLQRPKYHLVSGYKVGTWCLATGIVSEFWCEHLKRSCVTYCRSGSKLLGILKDYGCRISYSTKRK